MPELPDVEIFRRYLEATALHQKIVDVTVHTDRILEGVTARELKTALAGHHFTSARRHGKYLFAELNSAGWLVVHFGMTGSLKYFKREEERPDHERMVAVFENDYHLSFNCPRKLGKISLTKGPEDFVSEKSLGRDALDEKLDLETFRDLFEGVRSAVKSALMNQGLIAGIGNIYSDEILFQAGIYPKEKSNQLGRDLIEKLFHAMREVLTTAVDRKANPEDLPGSYIIPRRGKNGKCPRCGRSLKKITVSGRNGYYCEKCQPKS